MNDLFGKINKLEKKIEEQNQTIESHRKKINEMQEKIFYLISRQHSPSFLNMKKKIDSLNPEVYVDRNLKTEETMMNDYFAKLLNYWIAPYDTTAFILI